MTFEILDFFRMNLWVYKVMHFMLMIWITIPKTD